MSNEAEELFANLRHGPWNEDPNTIPQERAVGNGQIAAQGYLADNSVTADVIRASAVVADKIAAGAITTDKLAANAVTAAKIAAGTITANEIAANTITAAQIAANTITASELSASAVTTDKLAANAVTAAKIAANTITANEIAANTLTANEIAANAITASEIAADAVTTTKILAANVTSSRIELTVSGKNFGANDGTTGAPGIFFDSSSSSGLSLPSGGSMVLARASGGSIVMPSLGSNVLVGANTLIPNGDNVTGLGSSGSRWIDVWAVDGTINTSDARLKTDIADEPLGLDFIRSLRPVVYRWRDTVDTQARESIVLDEAGLAEAIRPHVEKIQEIRGKQALGKISDERAESEVEKRRARIRKIHDRYAAPIAEAQAKRRPGRRLHHGLIAQEVKAALDAAGTDAAFWKQTKEGVQSLAYSELIAPLIRAIQEQQSQIDALKERVNLVI